MNLSRHILLLGSAALAGTASATSLGKSRLTAARNLVKDLFAAGPVPSLSIAVMRADDLLWSEAFGTADLEMSVSATPAHRFRLGSVSKIITATLAAQLAAKGKGSFLSASASQACLSTISSWKTLLPHFPMTCTSAICR